MTNETDFTPLLRPLNSRLFLSCTGNGSPIWSVFPSMSSMAGSTRAISRPTRSANTDWSTWLPAQPSGTRKGIPAMSLVLSDHQLMPDRKNGVAPRKRSARRNPRFFHSPPSPQGVVFFVAGVVAPRISPRVWKMAIDTIRLRSPFIPDQSIPLSNRF